MNLKRLFSWMTTDQPISEPSNQNIHVDTLSNGTAENVVYLNPQGPLEELNISPDAEVTKTKPAISGDGLMYERELQTFFAQNYFGLGRHNGAMLKSFETYQLGRSELIANFQNACSTLLERKQAKINKLESEVIAIEGLSVPMTARLQLASAHLKREISQLEDQRNLAAEGKGWILEALNRYQMGFQQGMREAVEFELLSC